MYGKNRVQINSGRPNTRSMQYQVVGSLLKINWECDIGYSHIKGTVAQKGMTSSKICDIHVFRIISFCCWFPCAISREISDQMKLVTVWWILLLVCWNSCTWCTGQLKLEIGLLKFIYLFVEYFDCLVESCYLFF